MKVKLLTSVSSAEGSWANGIRDLPDSLAVEMLEAGFAEPVDGNDTAKAEKPKAARSKA
jgi:hypothetical protein